MFIHRFCLLVSLLFLTTNAFADGFGRFGRLNDDGLLTVNVTPLGFETVGDTSLSVHWGSSDVAAKQVTVKHLDPTGKTLLIDNPSDGAPSAVRYTLLYPGFSADFGKQIVLRLQKTGSFDTVRTHFNKPPFRIIFRRKGGGSWIALLLNGKTAPKLTIAADRLILTSPIPFGEVRFLTPLGLRENTKTEDAESETLRLATLPIPVRESSTAKVSNDGKSVTITEIFAGKIAPIPPVLSFALAHGYPAQIDSTIVTTEAVTKYGNFCYVNGNRLRYRLPIPDTDERGCLRDESANGQDVALLNDLVGHLGGDWATNAVDLGYAGMTNALLAKTYLSPAKRMEVENAWKRYLPHAWSLPPYTKTAKYQPWKIETEPFTHQSYLWTYKIDGPGHFRYDLDWGNALPLYGLQKRAEYSGDWRFVRSHWNDVGRVAHYFSLGDDWAWMTVVNADHGYSTGTGDPLAATFCASVACLKMARTMGDKDAELRYATWAARCAVPTVARFWYTDWARANGFINRDSTVLGYYESDFFTTAYELGKHDPWTPATLFSGDGLLPELFTLYRKTGKKAVGKRIAEYKHAFPHAYDGNFVYPFETTYHGNSVYVAFPILFARATVLDDSPVILLRNAKTVAVNRNNAWVGPNLIAELLSRRDKNDDPPILLTDWQPVAYLDGSLSRDGHLAVLHFGAASKPWALYAKLRNGLKVSGVQVNGQRAPFRQVGHRLQVSMPKSAIHAVIRFG